MPQHVAVPAALFVSAGHVRGGGVWRPRCGTAGCIGEALPKASTFIPSFGTGICLGQKVLEPLENYLVPRAGDCFFLLINVPFNQI